MDQYVNDALYLALMKYKDFNEQEQSDRKVMMKYMEMFDDIYDRENVFAHITSSPWIMNKKQDHVLMIYHNIFQSWSWCGGHCDKDRDTIHVALKEGMEETGLSKIILESNDILAIDVLPVPPHYKNGVFVTAHVHLNVTYLCYADEELPLSVKKDENSAVAWIPVYKINEMVTEEDMKVVYEKLIQKAKERAAYSS